MNAATAAARILLMARRRLLAALAADGLGDLRP